ncbi:MAG: nucleotide exchange factor GrpE [Alphaproteobacteria bacterium]|nr:nucleotide exchange factor GrpE [Alphaproteobacteria bacterium]MCB9791644.1 nucleotide exchange factor GrpE [Alphaproteobacteria bacterium]
MADPNNDASGTAELHAALEEIRDAMRERSLGERTQSQAFDALYEELRQYKEDFIYQAEKPLLLDLLLFYDSLNWFRNSLVNNEMSMEVVADSFQYLIDEFLEVLYRRDVLPMESSDFFNPKTQKAVKVEPAPDGAGDQQVSQVLKRGFTRGERVLRSEEVVIYRDMNKLGDHS